MATLSTDIAKQEGTAATTIEDTTNSTTQTSTTTTTTAEPTTSGSVTAIGIQGESGAASPLSQNVEVDVATEGLQNGSVLVYKTATSKWTATRNLDLQNMDAGEF